MDKVKKKEESPFGHRGSGLFPDYITSVAPTIDDNFKVLRSSELDRLGITDEQWSKELQKIKKKKSNPEAAVTVF